MTVSSGGSWGRTVPRPDDLRTVEGDSALTSALNDGSSVPTAVLGGDLARTLGGAPPEARDEVTEYNLDLVQVILDDGEQHIASAHVVAHAPWWRGSWWVGPVLAVMNAEYIGSWDVAPRGHPNDGRVETFACEGRLSIRQRLAVKRRLPSGSHLPHPGISSRPVRQASWTFKRRLEVYVDGRKVGRSHLVEIAVLPDAATMYR